jgi:hypothetical protein
LGKFGIAFALLANYLIPSPMNFRASNLGIILIILMWVMTFSNYSNAQPGQFSYQKQWKTIDSLFQAQLPESALKLMEAVYQKALGEKNQIQQINAFVRLQQYQLYKSESIPANPLEKWADQYAGLDAPNKAVLNAYQAMFLMDLFRRERHIIFERSRGASDPEDIATWDPTYFTAKMDSLFLKSIENPNLLAAIPSGNYAELLTSDSLDWDFRPTLFDLLAWKALDFYRSGEFDTNPVPLPWIAQKAVFYQKKTENGGRILHIFEQLENVHRSGANKTALFYAKLEKLKYIYEQSGHENKDEFYGEALQNLKEEIGAHPFKANILEAEASRVHQLAGMYLPDNAENEKYRDYLAEAVRLYELVISEFPESAAATRSANQIRQIKQPNIQVQVEKINRKGKPFFVLINYTNFDRLTARVYKVNSSEYFRTKMSDPYRQPELSKFSSARLVQESPLSLKPNSDYRPHAAEMAFKALPPGIYMLEMNGFNATDTCKISAEFAVSGMTFSEDAGLITVLDIENGNPIKGAEVKTSLRNAKEQAKVQKTNAAGNVVLPHQLHMVQVSLKGDTLIMRWYAQQFAKTKDVPFKKMYLFTDRSVYRPGQKVLFKGILLNLQKGEATSVTQNEVRLILRNANYQSIDTLELVTNQYGSVSGSFALPSSGLPGDYLLQSDFGNESFRVESYRRPGFEITINPMTDEIRLGSKVTISGTITSFSGVALKNVSGKYRVTRSPQMWRYRASAEVIESGTFTADETGKFTVSFLAKADSLQKNRFAWHTQYNVELEATDISGETQTASKSLMIGKSAIKAELSGTDFFELQPANAPDKKALKIQYSIQNADQQPIRLSGKIELIRLKFPAERLLSRSWEVPDSPVLTENEWYRLFPEVNYGKTKQPLEYEEENMVSAQHFENAAADSVSFQQSRLTSGYYKIKLVSSDKFGEPVKAEKVIRVMDLKQRKFAFNDLFFASVSQTKVKPGDKLTFTFGGAGSHRWNVKVIKNDSVVAASTPVLSQAVQQLILPVEKNDQGGFSISVSSVYKGKYYSRNYWIEVPYTERMLKMEIIGLPKTAEPGKPVSWKVKLSDSNGKPVKAELAGVVYDASLDKILPHHWQLALQQPNRRYRFLKFPTGTNVGFGNCYDGGGWQPEKNPNLPELGNLFNGTNNHEAILYTFGYGSKTMIRGTKSTKVGALAVSDQMDVEQEVQEEIIPITRADMPAPKNIEVRSDFRETAWFDAHLETDENGEALIRFTLPESVTQWKFMALAHTTKGASGTVSGVFTAQKKLMIEPFPTRFLKVGDTVVLPVKVSNLSGKAQSVSVEMKLVETGTEPWAEVLSHRATIELADSQSEAVEWKFTAPSKPGIYKIRITALGDQVSDGYETVLPVEPSSMWVNESQAYSVKPQSTFKFDIKKLGVTTKTDGEKWEINLFANPLGLVLDAIPQLLQEENNTTTGNLMRMRGAATVRKIFADHPEIARWIARQREQLLTSPGTFQTALEKAETFKQVKLDETPWLAESEYQKEKLRKFNTDSINETISGAIEKLENEQLPDGGFSWCPGMGSSSWVTIQLLENIAEMRTDKLLSKAENDRFLAVAEKAFLFLDRFIQSEYLKIADKQRENYEPGSDIVDWLYARNAFPEIAVQEKIRTIADFYFEKAVKNRLKVGMWQQLQLASMLKAKGNDRLARTILLSFTERAVKNKETGMFWKRAQTHYFYREPDIAFQARMIQFYTEMGTSGELIDAMKTWLLQQKRTHAWRSAFATSKAISVMLAGERQVVSGIVAPKIRLDGKILALPEISDPTGRIYLSLNPSEIGPDSKLEIENSSNSLLFGGLFHGYFKEDSDLTRSGGPLKIRKELFGVSRTAKGDSLLADFSGSRPGDLLKVRLLIETDRDLGFVSLTDQRPAGTEPIGTLSQYEYNAGLWYYRANSDNDTRFFISDLPTGRHMLEYVVRVSHQGKFSGGRATVQCAFAPEFGANHAVGKISLGDK